MSLTAKQQDRLSKFRRSILPKYYDSRDQETYSIPHNTQDALILTGNETKSKAVSYLKKLADAEPSQRTKDYNELLGLLVDNQVANSDAAATDMEQVTGKFTEFIQSFRVGGAKSANSIVQTGLQPVFDAMVRRLGPIADIGQNVTFHKNYSAFMKNRYTQDINTELKKELRSWVRVIVSYPSM